MIAKPAFPTPTNRGRVLRLALATLLTLAALPTRPVRGAGSADVVPSDLGDELGWRSEDRLAEGPLERRLLTGARGAPWPYDLLDGALVACGETEDASLSAGRRLYDDLRRAVRLPDAGLPTRERARLLLEELHRLMLVGGYDAQASDLRRSLRAGAYNCVSATVLYQSLCAEIDLPVRAVAAPAHVYCRHPGPPTLDVQTTCATWLRQAAPDVSHLPREALTQAARELSDPQLIAKIYYNRGVAHLGLQEHAEAVRLLRISLLLDPDDETARANLLAAINNWALAECQLGRHERAEWLLVKVAELDPAYAPLRANELHVRQQWVRSLCEREQFSEALRLLDEGHARRPEAPLYDQGRLLVARLWAGSLFEQGLPGDGLAVLERVRESAPHDARWQPAVEQAVLEAATRLASTGQREAAIGLVDRGLARLPQSVRLQQFREHLTRPRS